MTKKLIVVFLFVFHVLGGIYANAQLIYPIVGTYKGNSAQGMAVFDNKAYLMNDGGHCRILNLESGIIEREFDLECSDKNTHINCASFGVEISGNTGIPFLYVSETNKPHRCFIEDINGKNPKLIQTIEAVESGNNYSNHNWVVDRKNNCLYGLKCYWHQYVDEAGNIKTVITKYRLPKICEGKNVLLSEKDILDRFEVHFTSSMQGTAIKNGKMFIATGSSEREKNTSETKRMVIVIDLRKKRITKKIDINLVTTNEPEGIDFYHSKCLLFCGQTGGVYRIK